MAELITVKDCVSHASMELGIAQRPIQTAMQSDDQDIVQMVALLSAVADEVLLDQPYRDTLGDGLWIATADGTPKPKPTADDDFILFNGRLAIDGLKFRFLKAKGLEYGEEMRDFTHRLNKLAGRVNGRVIDLDTRYDDYYNGGSPWGFSPYQGGGRQQ
jgi:hypothetical protein